MRRTARGPEYRARFGNRSRCCAVCSQKSAGRPAPRPPQEVWFNLAQTPVPRPASIQTSSFHFARFPPVTSLSLRAGRVARSEARPFGAKNSLGECPVEELTTSRLSHHHHRWQVGGAPGSLGGVRPGQRVATLPPHCVPPLDVAVYPCSFSPPPVPRRLALPLPSDLRPIGLDFFFFFLTSIYFRESKTEHEWGRGRETGETQNPKRAPGCQHRARRGARTHGP